MGAESIVRRPVAFLRSGQRCDPVHREGTTEWHGSQYRRGPRRRRPTRL